MVNWYVDAAAAPGGNGTLTTPYHALSALNWALIATGDTIYLARGSVFREQWSPPKGDFTVSPYGTGATPTISGSVVLTGWAATIGEAGVYEAACSTSPTYVFFNKQRRMVGSAATSAGLPSSKNWFWSNGKLYVKSPAGSPDSLGWLVEASVRTSAVYLSGIQSSIIFRNIHLTQCSGRAFYQAGYGGGHIFHEIEISHSERAMWANQVTVTAAYGRSSSIHHIYGTSYPAITAMALTVFERTVFYHLFSTGIQVYSTSTCTANSCTFAGIYGPAVQTRYSTSTAIVKNSIIAGCNRGGYAIDYYQGLGSITVSDCLLTGIGSPISTVTAQYLAYMDILPPGCTSTNNTFHALSGFKRMPPVYITPTFDDWDIDYIDQVQKALLALGRATFTGVTHYRSVGRWATFNQKIHDFIADGGEVGFHSATHTDVSVTHPLSIQYVGTGPASMTINSNTLTTVIDGSLDLSLDLASSSYSTLGKLASYIDSLANYTCTWIVTQAQSSDSVAANLADVAAVDIKTAPYAIGYDLDRFYDFEIQGCIDGIYAESGGYVAKSASYPYGTVNTQTDAGAAIQERGLLTVRTVAALTVTSHPQSVAAVMEHMPMHRLYCLAQTKSVNSCGLVMQIANTSDVVTDGSDNYNAMTLSGSVSISNAVPAAIMQGYYSALFSGGYLYRTSLNSMKYVDRNGRGDWQWGVYLYPTVAPTAPDVATLFWHQIGTGSPTDYHWLYMDSDRILHYQMVKGGNEVLHLTAATTLTLNTAHNLVLRQSAGKTELIRYDANYAATVLATSTSTATLEATGRFQIGASYLGGVAGNIYRGHMDNAYVARWAWQLGIAQVEQAASSYQPLVWYSHTLPNPTLFRTLFDAWANYSSSTVYVRPIGTQVASWLSQGEFDEDMTYLHLPSYTPDFSLQIASPANRAGDGVTYLGALPPVSGRKLRSYRRP